MHLKVLLVPSLVVLTLVLAIGFIKPSVADMQMKQAELELTSARLADVETASNNVNALNASLDSRKEAETFVKQYLPESMDQDRPMDAFNFLASQSGVVLTNMEFKDVNRIAAMPVDDGTVDLAAAAEAAAFADPTPETYIVSAEIRGSYEGIKTFLTRASRMNRLHDISSFGITIDEAHAQDQSGTTVVDPAMNLVGSFVASFPYFAGRPAAAIVSAPLFQQAQFDFGPATAALEKSSESIPPLDRPQSGRPNPFR
jgi:hypothetical protein